MVPVVLQVLPRLETGGVERGTVDMAAAIADKGWRPVVASGGGVMVREIERAGGVHVTMPVYSKKPVVMRANFRRLGEVIRDYGVNIVHARSRAPAWCALAAAHHAGVPFVTTFHGTYSDSNPVKRLYNSVMVRGERVIAISDFIRDRIIARYGTDPDRIRVIHRGVDLDVFNPVSVSPERMIQLANQWRLPDDMPIIMLPARLTRWKGHDVLIEALARIGRDDLRCVLVGDDQGRTRYRQDLDQHIKRAGVSEIVQIVGGCRDMPAAYMLADVVISASTDAEAFGRIAAEAQALGKPVIATDLGAARETVLPGETGWLVPPGDPDALTAALTEVLALTADQRETMAARAIAHVRENFDRDDMCAKTLEIYQTLFDTAAAPA